MLLTREKTPSTTKIVSEKQSLLRFTQIQKMTPLLSIPSHGRNISFTEFNKINNLLYQHSQKSSEYRIKYPSFVKPYVVGLIKKFENDNKLINIRGVEATNAVAEYLHCAKIHPLNHLFGRRVKSSSFPYRNSTDNIYNDLISFLQKNSIPIEDDFIIDIGEIGENAREHSSSIIYEGSFGMVAQYYPRIERLEICIIDSGIGISKKIFNFFKKVKKEIPDFEEIEKKLFVYAFEEGMTTRSTKKGGKGLTNLRKHLPNNAKLAIACNNHYYTFVNKDINPAPLDQHFQGTFIHLTLEL